MIVALACWEGYCLAILTVLASRAGVKGAVCASAPSGLTPMEF